MPKIIAFIGTVGSGKSTQIEILATVIDKTTKIKKAHPLKTNHLPSRILVSILCRLVVKRESRYFPIKALIEQRPMIFARLFKLWLYIDIVGLVFKFLVSIYLPFKAGYTVLVEEYIPAALADYIYIGKTLELPYSNYSSAIRFITRLIHLFPVQFFFLDASLDELNARWKYRGSINESADYLSLQRNLLFPMAQQLSQFEVVYINTSSFSIMETHKKILDRMMKVLD